MWGRVSGCARIYSSCEGGCGDTACRGSPSRASEAGAWTPSLRSSSGSATWWCCCASTRETTRRRTWPCPRPVPPSRRSRSMSKPVSPGASSPTISLSRAGSWPARSRRSASRRAPSPTSCWRSRGHSLTTPSSFRPAPTSRCGWWSISSRRRECRPRPRWESTGVRRRQTRQCTRGPAERRAWEERRRPGRARHVGIERRRGADRRVRGERRLHLINGQRSEIERLHETLGRSARSMAWDAVLAAALALVRLAPQVPAGSRRMFGIQVRRAIPRRAVESLVDLAEAGCGAPRARSRSAAVDRVGCRRDHPRPRWSRARRSAYAGSTTT